MQTAGRAWNTRVMVVAVWAALLSPLFCPCAAGDDELAGRATWSLPTPEQVRQQLDAVLQLHEPDEATRNKITAIWAPEESLREPSQLLAKTAETLALLSDGAREVVEFCHTQTLVPTLKDFAVLTDEQQPPFVRNNLRLLYGQWLAQNRYYDESLQQLDGLLPADVIDPAALLFYQSTGYHRMLDKKQCLPLAARLLENEKQIPRRFATIAHLMQADLEPLKTDSLDEISRLMDEVQRRLDLKRAGTRVREQEEEVIAKLDKLIKQLEEQQQSASSAANLAPSSPAQDSRPMGGLAPGNIDPKSIGTNSGWGNLPPKERQEALQQIGKDLPAHYREVIEEYFRKLAREGGSGN